MCGRDALYGQVSRLREAFDAEPEGFDFEPRWNAASMQSLPVVRQRPTGERLLRVAASGKQAFYIHPVGSEFFAFAALWERWMRPADSEELDTFTIVTTEANAAMRPLHDRMPVILAPGDYWAWLNGATEADQIQALVRPVPGRRSRCIRWGSRSAT